MTEAVRTSKGWVFWLFVALMLALTGLFIALGAWQLERLGEKEALMASVDARLNNPPVPFPSPSATGDLAEFDFAPVSLAGHFVPGQSLLVFTSLGEEAKGKHSGPGYWVMTPFALDAGGTAFVNRGFVPQADSPAFRDDKDLDTAPQTLTGIARLTERVGGFTPDADKPNRIEWVRTIDRLAALVDPSLAPFSQLYVDLPAGAPGVLPQGGETVVEFSNRHLEYAGTWFCFAAITPIMLLVWVRRQRKRKVEPATSSQ
jgi:surfeit locus 1 family protein